MPSSLFQDFHSPSFRGRCLLSEVTGPAISIDEEPGVIEEMKRFLNGLAEAHFEKPSVEQ
jgi:hypothetical protein